jgi:hypothetical protein
VRALSSYDVVFCSALLARHVLSSGTVRADAYQVAELRTVLIEDEFSDSASGFFDPSLVIDIVTESREFRTHNLRLSSLANTHVPSESDHGLDR